MPDRYQQVINTPFGRVLSKKVGLPQPVELERYTRGRPVIEGPVLLGAATGSRLAPAVAGVLAAIGAEAYTSLPDDLRAATAAAGLKAEVWIPRPAPAEQTLKALVFDATGIGSSEQLHEAWAFFHPTIRRLRGSGRVIMLGTPPAGTAGAREATAQRALEGLTRSIGKELRRGATAQLVYVTPGAQDGIESTLRFLLSPRSAYVCGQVIRIQDAAVTLPGLDWERPLEGLVALVTGASRGIGAAVAEVLARDGAHVVGLDLPAQASALEQVTNRLDGSSLILDITDHRAPEDLAAHLRHHHGGVDVVVHNAGVTRDKTLGRMSADQWDLVLDINLTAQERIDDELLAGDVIRENGRIISVSSISGIAGNAGQANYATSKAGVIGMVESLAGELLGRKLTINAVAPGFIETQMTATMPIASREVGRRMNSVGQGGLPVDVAETVAWYASPASAGVTGNVVRVCGQSVLGA